MRPSRFLVAFSLAAVVACASTKFKGGATRQPAGDPIPSGTPDDPAKTATDTPRGTPATPSRETEPAPGPESPRARCTAAAATALRTAEQSLRFPARSGCSFGSGQNLARAEGRVQASETSTLPLALPGGDICAIAMQSAPDARLRYDDFLVLSVDKHLVFLSNGSLTTYLGAPTSGLLTWDFRKVAGQAIPSFEAEPYCLGQAGECGLPNHDQEGAVALRLPTASIAPLAAALRGKTTVPVNLTVIGDNDDQDCSHTGFDVRVSVTYLP